MNTIAVLPSPVSVSGRGPRTAVRMASRASGLAPLRVLILGTTPLADRIIREIAKRPNGRWCVIGVMDDAPASPPGFAHCRLLGPTGHLAEIVDSEQPDRVIVALAERRGRTPIAALVESCVTHGIQVDDAAEFYERLTGKLAVESLTPTSIVFSKYFRPSRFRHAFARALSLLVAIGGLIVLSPLMALIAVAVKLESPGPALFVQERAGRHGKTFRLLKFRTMRVVTTRRSEWEGDNRDRVTRVGKWLRKTRLDELPQFVNILRGEMNLVGPRPHPVSNLALFTLVSRNLNELTGAAVGFYSLRSMVRPGITGWAQTRYGYANSLEQEIEKLRYDLYYVKYYSPWLDLRILLDTIKVVFKGYSVTDATAADAAESVAAARLVRVHTPFTRRSA